MKAKERLPRCTEHKTFATSNGQLVVESAEQDFARLYQHLEMDDGAQGFKGAGFVKGVWQTDRGPIHLHPSSVSGGDEGKQEKVEGLDT